MYTERWDVEMYRDIEISDVQVSLSADVECKMGHLPLFKDIDIHKCVCVWIHLDIFLDN